MPRAQSKTDLLASATRERAAFERLVAPLTPAQLARGGILGEWSVRDVIAHLVEWEQMVLRWLAAGERGETPAVPAPGFKWSQLPALNAQIRAAWAPLPGDEVLARAAASYAETIATIERLADDDLFTPGRWPWMNRNTLAA
ncbi:MAG: hypothetical protein C0418_04785, partial [Coriobacteriaceae bacterium]|nr:hypothetical protein [Coriobacteriaceae bacterium]